MRTPIRLLLLVLVAASLTLAGCSYTPARVQSRPLVEIDTGYPYYSGRRYYHDDDHYHRHRDYRRDRRYRYDGHRHDYYDDRGRDHRGRGGFCPPGLRMQGRC